MNPILYLNQVSNGFVTIAAVYGGSQMGKHVFDLIAVIFILSGGLSLLALFLTTNFMWLVVSLLCLCYAEVYRIKKFLKQKMEG